LKLARDASDGKSEWVFSARAGGHLVQFNEPGLPAHGTDHGTATIALLAGGALKGGRLIADWPGLSDGKLHENRDLKPTTDLRAILKGLLRDHLRVDERALASTVFPGSSGVRAVSGLLA
jgi:uncharacterized protein (DUF1501 family)